MQDSFFVIPARILLILAASIFMSASAFSQKPADNYAKLELVAEQDAIVPNQELRVGIRFDLQDGWHTYWVNPGDAGEAPRIDWNLPAGLQAGSIQWPYPERLSTPPFADYGYQHQVLLVVAIQPPAGLKEGTQQKLSAHVRYLVCHDVCIPGQKQLELTLPVRSHAAPSSSSQLFQITRQRLPQTAPGNWKLSAVSDADEFILNIKTRKPIASLQFFPLDEEQIENAAAQSTSAIPNGIRLHLKKSKQLLKPISRLKGVLIVGSGTAYLVDVPISQQKIHARS